MKKPFFLIIFIAIIVAGTTTLLKKKPAGQPATAPAQAPIEVSVAQEQPDSDPQLPQAEASTEPSGLPVIQVVDQKQFVRRTARVLEDLPTVSTLQKLKEEDLHRTPDAIREAGTRLGEIAQLLAEHPEFEPEAFVFYDRCALRSDLPATIRALCLSNLKKIGTHLGRPVDTTRFPSQVIDLSKRAS